MNTLHPTRHQIGTDPSLEGFNQKDGKGEYKLVPVDGPGGAKKGNPYYEFMGVTGYWRFSKETMQEKYNQGLIVKTETSLQQKYYLEDAKKGRKTETTWFDKDYLTSTATKELKDLMDGAYFDNPKNINLLTTFLKMITHYAKDAIIMDFFSGSATTAHAVMKLNAEDGGTRKFIMVQLDEKTDEKSEAHKAGYKMIPEIGKERIRRAGKKIADANRMTAPNLDIGFRVLKLDDSNMREVFYNPTAYQQDMLLGLDKSIKEDRTAEDILFQVMLDKGVSLSSKIEKRTTANGQQTYYIVGSTDFGIIDLICCLDNKINTEAVKEIAKLQPECCVFLDSGIANDATRTNIQQIFDTYSAKTKVEVL